MAKVVIQLQDASKLLDVHAVEAAVTQLEGVEYARVSRTTGKVTVAFDASRTSQTAIEHALQALGHMTSDVQPANTIRIPIEGMTCASCQVRI
ncbi:MAG: heavy metal-associated domain-containing protein, partial [Candidatus Limiplasma sp.]|nr:heavy metal-associated domain-containing protein [Candidatus Limiplasma sp.]